MSTNEIDAQDCIDSVPRRSRRALEECMSILPNHPQAKGADGLFAVIGENERGAYIVDRDTGVCECDDYRFRTPENGCKHIRRVEFSLGDRPIPAEWIEKLDIDCALASNIDAEPRFLTADGGIINGTTGETIVDDDDPVADCWDKRAEVNKHGRVTGAYLICRACGRDVMTWDDRVHKPECPHADDDEEEEGDDR